MARMALDEVSVRERVRDWRRHAATQFLDRYRARIGSQASADDAGWMDNLLFHLFRKAFDEVEHEAAESPERADLAAGVVIDLLARGEMA